MWEWESFSVVPVGVRVVAARRGVVSVGTVAACLLIRAGMSSVCVRVCLRYGSGAPRRGRGSPSSSASLLPEYVSRAPRSCPTPRGAGVRARGAGVGVLVLEGLALEVEGVALESSRGSNWRGHLWRAGSASSFSEAPDARYSGVCTGWIESGPISPVGINPEGATSAPQYFGR